jgi:hypothetical protein
MCACACVITQTHGHTHKQNSTRTCIYGQHTYTRGIYTTHSPHTCTQAQNEKRIPTYIPIHKHKTQVRDMVFGNTWKAPKYSGAEVFYGVAPGPDFKNPVGDGGNDWCGQYMGRGTSLVSVPCRIVRTHSAFPSLAGVTTPVDGVYYGFVRHVSDQDDSSESWDSWHLAGDGPKSAGFSRGEHDASVQGDRNKDALWAIARDGSYGDHLKELVDRTPAGRLLRFKMNFRGANRTW